MHAQHLLLARFGLFEPRRKLRVDIGSHICAFRRSPPGLLLLSISESYVFYDINPLKIPIVPNLSISESYMFYGINPLKIPIYEGNAESLDFRILHV